MTKAEKEALAKILPSNEEFQRQIEMAATPIDFDQLVADGVLKKRGAWWEVLVWERLPQHAQFKIRSVMTGSRVQFYKPASIKSGTKKPPAKKR